MEVPVEMPEGVSYEGVFGGEAKQFNRLTQFSQLNVASGMVDVTESRRGRGAASGSGVGAGYGGGVGGGTFAMPTLAVPPPPPPPSSTGSKESAADTDGLKLTPRCIAQNSGPYHFRFGERKADSPILKLRRIAGHRVGAADYGHTTVAAGERGEICRTMELMGLGADQCDERRIAR